MGMTPNLLMLGREVRLPAEIMFGIPGTEIEGAVNTYGEYVEKLRDKMQKAHDVAREHIGSAAKRQKETYDVKRALHTYKVGDYIWFYTDVGQLGMAPKLRSPYEGPYLVIKKINDLNYMIQLDGKGRKKVVHHNRLKPYLGNARLRWAKSAIKKAASS